MVPSVDTGCRDESCEPCPVPRNGQAACIANSCGVMCDPGFVEMGSACVAPPPSCADHAKNGTETDVDCGGACPRCDGGKACNRGVDCISAACVNAICASQACDNGVQDSMESDIDCGGPRCHPCGTGDHCNIDQDCTDGTCSTGECRSASCNDQVTNGTETGTDCGGACEPCPPNQICKVDHDCASSHCVDGYCRLPCGSVSTANGCPPCTGLYSSCCRDDDFCGCMLANLSCSF